jgi:serine/threonine-protein kinase
MSDLIGRTIGQYQLVELTNETVSSQIYKGFQPSMNRYVAVQVLKPALMENPTAVQSFKQGSALLAQVGHPNIMPLFDSGEENGFLYRVMEYVAGGVLHDHLYEYYEPGRAAVLINGIVAGLEQIHSQGYVHGNLMSSNIYIREGMHPLLADYGVPKGPADQLTPYMSPEQIRGEVVDKRTDVYALGVLLYEMLIGETPPAGVVASPRAKRPDLPEVVEKLIFKAMAQDPGARFQSSVEFRNALSAALQPVVPAAVPPPVQTPQPVQPQPVPQPPPKKTNWAAIILTLILIIVICGGIALVVGYLTGDQTPSEPTQAPGITEVVPTNPPVQPTEEIPQPTQPPTEPGETQEAGQLPELPEDICGSVGFTGGILLLGGLVMIRRRKMI